MSLCSGSDREVLRRRRLSPSCLRDGRVVDRNLRRTAPTVGATGAIDGQLDPITDGGVLHLAHAPDVTLLHVLAQEHLAGGEVSDVGDAIFGISKVLACKPYSSACCAI